MDNFLKYCKENTKKVVNIIVISIIVIYIFLNRCFGVFNIIKIQAINNIIQIIMVLAIIALTVKTRKLSISKDKAKTAIKKCIDIFNKYILVKAIVILLVVKILESLITILINK